MAIDIGDAVLTFLGDTTQLDQSFNRVASDGVTKLQPAADAVNQMAGNWQFAGQTSTTALEGTSESLRAMTGEMAIGYAGAQQLGEVVNLAGEKSRESIYQARGETALLGEAFGIHLPRHVRSFLAELPGVGAALSAAFSATAVLFLLEALIKGTEKLVDWIDKTFIFTEAQRALNELMLDSNRTIVKYNEELQKLVEKYELIGTKGSERTGIEFKFTTEGEEKVAAQLRDIGNDITALNKGFRETSDIIPVVNSMIRNLNEGKKGDDIKKMLLPGDATKEQVIAALSALHGELLAKDKVFQQQQANQQKEFENQKTDEVKNAANKAANERIAEAKRGQDAELAGIEKIKAEQKVAFETGKINAAQWSTAEIKAAFDARAAHEAYLEKVIVIYKQAGEAVKAHAAAEELATAKVKNAAKANEDLAKATADLNKENEKYKELTTKTFEDPKLLAQIAVNNPLPLMIRDALQLNQELKKLGTEGFGPMQQRLAVAMKAEKALNDAGITEGKVWLQVQAAKLKAIIAIEQASGKSADAEIRALHKIEGELRKFDGDVKKNVKTMHEMWLQMQKDAEEFAKDLGSAFASVLTGQKSFGQAMEQAVAGLIAKIAQEWGEYYAALAIADMFWNPARAAAEFAAATALFTLSGVLGAVGQGGGSGGSSSGSTPPIDKSNPANQPGQQPVQVINAQHLALGGLVDTPRIALVGDSREAILPLGRDSRALDEIADRVLEGMGGQAGGLTFNVQGMISADHLHRFATKMNRDVRAGKVRINSSNSYRITRRG